MRNASLSQSAVDRQDSTKLHFYNKCAGRRLNLYIKVSDGPKRGLGEHAHRAKTSVVDLLAVSQQFKPLCHCAANRLNKFTGCEKDSHLNAVWCSWVYRQRTSGVLSPHNVAVQSRQTCSQHREVLFMHQRAAKQSMTPLAL